MRKTLFSLLLIAALCCCAAALAENDPALVGEWNETENTRCLFREDGTYVETTTTPATGLSTVEYHGFWSTENGSLSMRCRGREKVYAYRLSGGRLKLTGRIGNTTSWKPHTEPVLSEDEAALVGVWRLSLDSLSFTRTGRERGAKAVFFQLDADGRGFTAYIPGYSAQAPALFEIGISWRLKGQTLTLTGCQFCFDSGAAGPAYVTPGVFTVNMTGDTLILTEPKSGQLLFLSRADDGSPGTLSDEEKALVGEWRTQKADIEGYGPVFLKEAFSSAGEPFSEWSLSLNSDRTIAVSMYGEDGSFERIIMPVRWQCTGGMLAMKTAFDAVETPFPYPVSTDGENLTMKDPGGAFVITFSCTDR